MIELYSTLSIIDGVERGSLLAMANSEYMKFIKSDKLFVVIKINSDRVLIQNKNQQSAWFYVDQLKIKGN